MTNINQSKEKNNEKIREKNDFPKNQPVNIVKSEINKKIDLKIENNNISHTPPKKGAPWNW